jgi:addiction module RelB/DinJ family antitoxin
MPPSIVIRARIDERLKREAGAVLAAMGLTVSGAFRLMMMRIAQDKGLPFEAMSLNPKSAQKGKRDMSTVITPQMRNHAEIRTHDHFGFLGLRAAIACLYARTEGATQAEVTNVSAALGSPGQKYLNMLREEAPRWRHSVVVWPDPARGGKVYKLIYNPNHSAKESIDPPANWKKMNVPKAPPGVVPTPL